MKRVNSLVCMWLVAAGFCFFGIDGVSKISNRITEVRDVSAAKNSYDNDCGSSKNTRGCFFSDPGLSDLLSCFNTSNTDAFCMQANAFFMTDRRSHNAPVQSVAWLCDSPVGTYAAIGGFPENNIVGSTDTRVYKFDPDNGLLGNPIADLVHGSYVFGVSWVYIYNYALAQDYGAYLAVGGYPSCIDDNEVHIFHLSSSTVNPVPVAGYKHGSPIKSVSWLSCSFDGAAYLAIGGQPGTDGAEIRILKFKASDNSLTLLANRFHGAPINSVSWFYKPSQYPNYPPVLAVGGDPVQDVSTYTTIRLYTFNCEKESLQDLISGSQPGPYDNSALPKRVFAVKPAIMNVDLYSANALFVGVACESTKISQNTYTPGYLLAFFPPGFKTTEASLESLANFSVPPISGKQVNGYALDFNSSCTCGGSVIPCCPQITFGLGCLKDIVETLPLNIFSVGFISHGLTRVYTKFDDNITSLEWCKVDGGKVNYLLVGSESNSWNLSMCGGNEIAVYKALIVCRQPSSVTNVLLNTTAGTETVTHVLLNGSQESSNPVEKPATCICAHKECRRFPLQSDISTVLKWASVPGATLYKLYSYDGLSSTSLDSMDQVRRSVSSLTLLACINANAPLLFSHHCLGPCQKVNYLLTMINTVETEIPVAVVSL